MWRSPAAAMATNQITMTGAKKLATRAVPRLCPANKPSRMAMVQRPKDQREHAEHDVACDRPGFDRRNHRHAKRIKWACADVAVDDADAAESQRPEIRFVLKYAIGNRRGRAGPGVFVRYLGHGGRVGPDAPQNERRLISPLTRRQHAPARQVPRARGAFSHDRPDAITSCNASGRNIPVLFLEKPE